MTKRSRILIAALASGSGKTTVVCGILQALKKRGLQLRAFKCGPDYIDPMFHSRVIGIPSRNLDAFFMNPSVLRQLFLKNSRAADFSLIEGAMGYYDGIGSKEKASAYEIAQITKTPVVLVVDCKAAALSIVASIKGFLEFRSDSQIVGVILNRISEMRYVPLKEAIERELPVTVLGYLPYLKDCMIESRHLGLVTAEEISGLEKKLTDLAEQLEQSVDLDRLLQLGEQAALTEMPDLVPEISAVGEYCNLRIAYAKDEAFCFYYSDHLELLQQMGATLVPFSPISDSNFPENIHGLLLGGGYPELYAKKLSENQRIRESIACQISGGIPCIAECGGFLYLHRTLETAEGEAYLMVGVIDADAYPTKRLGRFGYITLRAKQDGAFWDAGECFTAHEFHYWESTNPGNAFVAEKPSGAQSWLAGHHSNCLLAGFPHLHFCGNPRLAERFLKQALIYKNRQNRGGTEG